MPKTKKKKQARFLNYKKIFIVTFFLGFLIFGGLVILYYQLPGIENLQYKNLNRTTYILDDTDKIISTIGEKNQDYLVYENFPDNLVNAVIAIEDIRFFSHYGIDIFSILRATITNVISRGYKQGGSTISQQLAKLYFLSPKKTLWRKIKEALLAIKIEQNFSKKEILELYLNKAYFGSGNYGIASASRNYFTKEVPYLSLNEAALLAGLLKAPSTYSPKINPELSQNRTDLVLANMAKYGFINEEEFIIARYQDNAWNDDHSSSDNYKFYTDYVQKIYEDQFSFYPSDLKIRTNFNKDTNQIINSAINKFFAKNPKLQKNQIAVVAMKPEGEVISIIGGLNYKKTQYNRAIYSKRQAGSSFKLFVYLQALMDGYKPNRKVIDEPIIIKNWAPKNYNDTYFGEMTFRESFVRSINSVSAKIGNEVGLKKIIKLAHKMGIKSNIPNLPSITLGSAEVNLLELTSAYAVIANDGYSVKPYLITSIADSYENNIYRFKEKKKRIIKKKYNKRIKDLLRGVVVWGTGKNANVKDVTIYGKTGTSQNYRDAWFIGFTDDIVIGIWIGPDKKQSNLKITGGSYPAKIFKEIIQDLYSIQ
jgi:penicillin-binding protein 1A